MRFLSYDRVGARRAVPLLDPFRAHATAWEEEPDPSGALVPIAVVFLTNRQCPFRCVMCDLWVNTLDETVPPGAIAAQIRAALQPASAKASAGEPAMAAVPSGEAVFPAASSGKPRHVKLYNAGSFFDPQAIPPDEDAAIAEAVSGFDRVIVEAHPAFLTGAYGDRCLRFRDRLTGRLEVAVGLETAHPDVLARLDKKMTLETFRHATTFLRDHGIDLRVFIILFGPPFMASEEGVECACRALDVARECGAAVSSVIPLRGHAPPRLRDLERVVEYGLTSGRSRVFADLWDVERLFACACAPARAERLRAMNLTQRVPPHLMCDCDARV